MMRVGHYDAHGLFRCLLNLFVSEQQRTELCMDGYCARELFRIELKAKCAVKVLSSSAYYLSRE